MKRETNKIIKSGGEPLFVGDDPVDQFPVNWEQFISSWRILNEIWIGGNVRVVR